MIRRLPIMSRLGLFGAWLLLSFAASAQVLIPTVRPGLECPAVTSPADVLPSISNYTLVLPTHSDTSDKTLGVLRYDGSNVVGSEADDLYTVGTFSYRYFYVVCNAGVNEVVMRAPISGSPTTASPPSGVNDHTRTEFRQKTPGPSGHTKGTTEPVGDFLLSEKLHMCGVFRPTRFPDRPNTGDESSPNNLTLMQLQPTDTSGALTTFVILSLRKTGLLEATMYGADGANAATGTADDLLTGVQLGDKISFCLTTAATSVYWEAENLTRAPGVVQTLTITVPNTSAAGVNTRTRYYAHKFGTYHGTNVPRSSDDIAGKRVGGVVPFADAGDYAESHWISETVEYLP